MLLFQQFGNYWYVIVHFRFRNICRSLQLFPNADRHMSKLVRPNYSHYCFHSIYRQSTPYLEDYIIHRHKRIIVTHTDPTKLVPSNQLQFDNIPTFQYIATNNKRKCYVHFHSNALSIRNISFYFSNCTSLPTTLTKPIAIEHQSTVSGILIIGSGDAVNGTPY